MITVLIGGDQKDIDATVSASYPCLSTLVAGHTGSFYTFCRRVVASVQRIRCIDHLGQIKSDKFADDNFCVHFDDRYMSASLDQGTAILKLATVVETAIDLNLSIRLYCCSHTMSRELKERWPSHWPSLRDADDFNSLIGRN